MKATFDTRYPSVTDLRNKAKKSIPRFAFEYLDGGCNDDINLHKNTSELREVELAPYYLRGGGSVDLSTTLFGHRYAAPFGVAPIGLQGLIYPDSPRILAKAAFENNIPFILSTVTTSDIETIAATTEGRAWFQLYHPAQDSLRDDILQRLKVAGYDVLVLLSDVPSFGFRPRDIRNGLAMPPRMTLKNIAQIMTCPGWGLKTLYHGIPSFATMKRYMPPGLNMKQLGAYMNQTFSGRLNEARIKAIRDQWPGKLVIKGIATVEDTERAIALGVDGIIVSNHGGRQLDAGESSVHSLQAIKTYKDKITVMLDSGLRSGPDVARAMAAGAEFVFLGRTFMYAVAALGRRGGEHAIALLAAELKQVLEQLGCGQPRELERHLISC